MSYGGDFALANFNNLCNTWGQNVIEASKDRCYLSCMGHVFAFFNRHFRPCQSSLTNVDSKEHFALMTRDEHKARQLFLINHSGQNLSLDLGERGWRFQDGLQGAGRLVSEKEGKPSPIRPLKLSICGAHISLPPLSVCCLVQPAQE